MAIKKMSSQDYNNILNEATQKIENISLEMKSIRNDFAKKLNIIKHENEYLNYLYDKNSFAQPQDDTFIFLNNNNFQGLFSNYSNVVHAYFKQTPINIFNLKVLNSEESFFRDEAKVKINNIEDEVFKNILKADDIKDKQIFFEEYENNSAINKLEDGTLYKNNYNLINITIEKDNSKAIGNSKFNVIEFDPFLYKSFDIESINIYTNDSDIPTISMNNIKKVGKTRFILDKKYDFKKVEFNIKTYYSTTLNDIEIWPFGLKHIYFLEADFRNDSYIIVDYTSDDYIDEVKDNITIITSTSTKISSLSEEGIRIFLSNNNGMLENEHEPSNELRKPIARNLNTIYFYIPLKNESIIGYKFSILTR